MDEPTRTIFRSWNWPSDEKDRFSHRPTPNHISRVSFISPGRIYRSWNNLFQNGYIRKVIFLPSEKIIPKSTVIIPDSSYENFLELRNRIGDFPFVETIHFGRIYVSAGSFSQILESGKSVLSLSVTEASRSDAEKISRLILGNRAVNPLMFDEIYADKNLKMKATDLSLVRELSYRNIYEIEVGQISRKLDINPRTARRKIDRLISERLVYAYPLLNQVAIKGFNLFMIVIHSQLDRKEFFNILNEGSLGERYLLYMRTGQMLAAMFYYENLQEMDHIIAEIAKTWDDYMVITRFDTAVRDP